MAKSGSGEREGYWRGVVERQRRSGQTVLGFCRENGIAQASFYHWRARLASSGRGRPGGAVVPAVSTDAVGALARPSDGRSSQPTANGRGDHQGRRVGSAATKGSHAGVGSAAAKGSHVGVGSAAAKTSTAGVGSPTCMESATATGMPAAAEKRRSRAVLNAAVVERHRPRAVSNVAVELKPPLSKATSFIPLKLPAVMGLGHVIEVVLPRGHLVRVPAGFDGEALRRILELLDPGDA